MNGNFTWVKFSQVKKLNFFGFLFYVHRKQLQTTAGQIYPLSFTTLTSIIGIKWAATKENSFNISLRPTINKTTNESTSSGTFKQLFLDIKNDNKLWKNAYYNITTKWMLAANNGQTYSIKPISGITFYKYFLKDQNVQLNIGVFNIFIVTYTQDITASPVYQSRSTYDHLGRFFSLGLIFYPERWGK